MQYVPTENSMQNRLIICSCRAAASENSIEVKKALNELFENLKLRYKDALPVLLSRDMDEGEEEQKEDWLFKF